MRHMKGSDRLKQATRVLALALLTLGVIAVQDVPAASGPCADDIAKYCKDVKRGDGRLARCLKENEKRLSPACSSSIDESKKRVKEAHQACESDARTYCRDVKPGQGRIVKCLRENEKELSPECKAKITEPKNK